MKNVQYIWRDVSEYANNDRRGKDVDGLSCWIYDLLRKVKVIQLQHNYLYILILQWTIKLSIILIDKIKKELISLKNIITQRFALK